MKNWKIYCLFLISALTDSCIEPFSPNIKEYDDLLVVEALITDEASSQFVSLTRSHPIDTSRTIIESGASIYIQNSGGENFQFRETSPGHYFVSPGSFVPVPGEIYTLTITTFDGSIYQSDPVVMKSTPPIENLQIERTSIPSEETGGFDDGFQISVDTGTGSDEPGYYKYDWEETWELVPLYPSFYDYNPQQGIIAREENISDCWITTFSTNLNIVSTENISSDIIKGHSIRFIPFREPKLNVRYSILIKQYALSQNGFYFWKNIKDSNEITGSLYDKQPFQVIGNIKNITNPNETVLGYFDMTSVSSKRIFIDKRDVPDDVRVPSLYSDCRTGADTIVSGIDVPIFLGKGYLISYFIFMQGYVMANRNCVDCRLKGSNVKPLFWDDEN